MEKNRYTKLKQLKIGLQTMRCAWDHLDRSGLCYGYDYDKTIAMEPDDFFRVVKSLHMEPVIEARDSPYYRYQASFYYEGFCIYCVYDEDRDADQTSRYAKKLMAKFKEYFFETEDKECAFLQLREYELGRNLEQKYPTDPENLPIYWMKSYHDLERYFRRHSSTSESYESRYSKYMHYREHFEALDDETTWNDTNRLHPYGDWNRPLTFRAWNKANY